MRRGLFFSAIIPLTFSSVPADDGTWQPARSGNQRAREGDVVVKRFGTRLGAYARESTLLAAFDKLDQPLPVPRLLPGNQFGELRYAYVDGVSGMDAIAVGLAPQVLGAMGTFLRRLHTLAPEPFADVLPGTGPVVSHGAFAPYNVLVDRTTGALLAVLDWEEARRDSPALDRAWCEAQVLGPELAAALGAERFLSAINTTAKLQHPHILSLPDSGEASGFHFCVTPFVDGESAGKHPLPACAIHSHSIPSCHDMCAGSTAAPNAVVSMRECNNNSRRLRVARDQPQHQRLPTLLVWDR